MTTLCLGTQETTTVMVIKSLRQSGANFSAKDEYEMTGLHLAAIKGNYDVIQYVLRMESDLIFEKDRQVKFKELTYHYHSLTLFSLGGVYNPSTTKIFSHSILLG